ncbi:MAG TPA: FCD domain-containing protein [Gaiellaceae bacterium]|nr:FCD domain-containing protein [Gaiellaceae bacterium]
MPAPASRPFVEAIESTRTFEAAIEHLVEGIERAGLRAGARLPTERDLAAELGISVPTLRQALTVLERSGLLGARQGKGGGWFVTSELVPAEAISAAVAVEEELAIESLRARRLVESSIARYVALTATPEDVAQLEWANELLERHLDDRASVMEADAAFHRALVRAARSRPLQEAMRPISRHLHGIRDAYGGGREENLKTLRVHRRQTKAIAERDLDALERVLDEHLRMLEDAFAAAIGRSAKELFRTVRAAS